MKKFIIFLLIVTGIITFSAAQTAGNDLRQEGIASWYGQEFEGRPTASGEIFDPSLFTAAHPSLPFGTLLTVTNKQNMRQVTVKVNDRGPFVAARIIDLSKASAEVLDMVSTGTAPVIIERAQIATLGPVPGTVPATQVPATAAPAAAVPAIAAAETSADTAELNSQINIASSELRPPAAEPVDWAALESNSVGSQIQPQDLQSGLEGQPAQEIANAYNYLPAVPAAEAYPPAVPAAGAFYPAPAARILGGIPPAESVKSYRLQVGAFKVPRNAVDAFDRLKNAGLNPAYEQNGEFYRVVLAGLRAAEIPGIAQTLGNTGFPEAILREEY